MCSVSVVVFDVNETLSDMAPMAQRFADVGAPEQFARLWFAHLLRDGFALAAAGAKERFVVLAEVGLRNLLAGVSLNRPLEEAVTLVLDGFSALQVHPDVAGGVRALRNAGLRLVTLTNGSARVADTLLSGAGLRDDFEMVLSVDDAPAWKPASASYRYAAVRCRTPLEDMLLVAVHPWDVDGASRAGMKTAWLNRGDDPYPSYFASPTLTTRSLPQLAEVLASR